MPPAGLRTEGKRKGGLTLLPRGRADNPQQVSRCKHGGQRHFQRKGTPLKYIYGAMATVRRGLCRCGELNCFKRSQFYPDFIHDLLLQRSSTWLHFPCKIQRQPHQRLFFPPSVANVFHHSLRSRHLECLWISKKKKKKNHSHLGLGAN